MNDTIAIRTEGLVKRYGDTTALDGVDLHVPAGTVLGLLGPNGAGKTTVVRILATLLRADAGRAWVCGHDVSRDPVGVRRLIGLTGQYASVDEDLSGVENLVLLGRLLGLSKRAAKARAAELLDRFALTEVAGRAARTYSGGMRRRLDLAASLVGNPEVLFLDEPTTGLDPHARNEVWDVVRDLVADGVTVLLTTQYLEEADHLADRITVINRGTVVADGRPEELKRRVGGQTLHVRPTLRTDLDVVERLLVELTASTPTRDEEAGALTVPVAEAAVLSALVRRLDDVGITSDELGLRLATLDEVFLALTAHPTDVNDTDNADAGRSLV
ncbi:daunorubicin resistance protein DrrA family ABC transporter ATP-binding protein [Saccharomonospora viridis]|jgi:oleandomycin transport system ATP-binding protein|uniref:Daunorubicin resistance ABC transporter ATP-binding subunit n=2 Tax=Saccharomonospora viridis TaxID=1852 RepID=C7MQH2_SACVD|nr:daunorubicin resistance protein DrrA family ABC transporter ATP-binding protein [Saccharomonospora viridis]ACU98499.1 daunorubicin resistance ABC transporter ATP-binding subunit [Saccharomonospora viridis DSM 43017]KHF44292.1 ABC transporter [Saccharomonospora viridis]SFP61209.1 oleandomycin transport system ATP-binding protein [Saccharomonospora viridis]